MRIVDLGKGISIQSEWHSVDEAATFCHVSRNTFIRKAKASGLKYSLVGRERLYHQDELNRMMKGKEWKRCDG